MAETKTLVQFHKKGDATAKIYGQTVAEGVVFTDGQDLQAKLSSLVNKIEIVKLGDDARLAVQQGLTQRGLLGVEPFHLLALGGDYLLKNILHFFLYFFRYSGILISRNVGG